MTREEAFQEINNLQDEYVNELIALINNKAYDSMKMLNFTSATGTGKTKMMSKLINRFPDYYFIITTLSKGQLHIQVRDSLQEDCNQNNFYVYGSADYKINSRLDADEIISKIPEGTKCIWLRDEGHIRTNRWDELLLNVCYKVINFSATNTHSDIQCNFTSTMMLRTVNQTAGTPEDAIKKLVEIKEAHKNIPNYNPCAIFRCVSGDANLYKMIIKLCKKYKLKHIDITEETYNMQEICQDDNEYDVIINKFKIVEGIDIRRAHVLYMDNKPGNNATTIQVIGRCRRNALLYRDDIDILDPKNKKLLNQTRACYVYYNVEKMKIDEDENGELQYAFCNHISCQSLKHNSKIEVINGQMQNGLYIIELATLSGTFNIELDKDTGFNIIKPITNFYEKEYVTNTDSYVYIQKNHFTNYNYKKISKHVLKTLIPVNMWYGSYVSAINNNVYYTDCNYEKPVYDLICGRGLIDLDFSVSKSILRYFYKHKKTKDFLELNIRTLESMNTSFFDKEDDTISWLAKELLSNKILELYEDYNLCPDYKDVIEKIIDSDLPQNIKFYYVKALIHVNSCFKESSSLYNIYSQEKNLLLSKGNLLNVEALINDLLDFLNNYKNDELPLSKKEFYIKLYFLYMASYNKRNSRYKSLIGLNYNYTIYGMLSYKPRLDIHFQKLETEYKENILDIDNTITTSDIDCFFSVLYGKLNDQPFLEAYKSEVIDTVLESISNAELCLLNKHGIIQIKFNNMIKNVSKEETYRLNNHFYNVYTEISLEQLYIKHYIDYNKQNNDIESSIIGVDLMKQTTDSNDNVIWIESRAVSSKVGNYNKLNTFISNRYNKELEQAKSQYIKGKNNFNIDKKCNSVIGYCVEYYSKYLLFGKQYLGDYIDIAESDVKKLDKYNPNNEKQFDDQVIIRACMLKYKENMCISFGNNAAKIIKTISVGKLIEDDYQNFVNIVKTLGRRVANFVKTELYKDKQPVDNIDPNLSIRHIAGLADYITEDTILDVKVNGCLNEGQVRQVLAYHYLSTKRSDLNIKRVIVYDATSGKHVSIDIEPENWKENCKYGYKEK